MVPSCWFLVATRFVVGGGVATGFSTTTTVGCFVSGCFVAGPTAPFIFVVSGFGAATTACGVSTWMAVGGTGGDTVVNEPNPKYRAPARAVPPIIAAAGILFGLEAAARTRAAAAAASWFLASRAFKFARTATNPAAPVATPIPHDEFAVAVTGFLVGGEVATADGFLVPAGVDRFDAAGVLDGGSLSGPFSRRDRGDDAGAADSFGNAALVVGVDLALDALDDDTFVLFVVAVVGAARVVRCFEAVVTFACISVSAAELGAVCRSCCAFWVVLVRSIGVFRWFGGLFVAGFGSDGGGEDAAAFDLVGLTLRSCFTFGFGSGVRSRLYSPVCAVFNTIETVEDAEALWRCRNTDGTTPLLVAGITKATTPLLPPLLATRIVLIPTATAIAAIMTTGLFLRIIIIIIILGCRCQTNTSI